MKQLVTNQRWKTKLQTQWSFTRWDENYGSLAAHSSVAFERKINFPNFYFFFFNIVTKIIVVLFTRPARANGLQNLYPEFCPSSAPTAGGIKKVPRSHCVTFTLIFRSPTGSLSPAPSRPAKNLRSDQRKIGAVHVRCSKTWDERLVGVSLVALLSTT